MAETKKPGIRGGVEQGSGGTMASSVAPPQASKFYLSWAETLMVVERCIDLTYRCKLSSCIWWWLVKTGFSDFLDNIPRDLVTSGQLKVISRTKDLLPISLIRHRSWGLQVGTPRGEQGWLWGPARMYSYIFAFTTNLQLDKFNLRSS